MRIRPATPEDLADVCTLIRELAAYERLEREVVLDEDDVRRHLFGDDPVASVLIAEVEPGTVAGFALYFRTFSTFLGRPGVWLEDLFVRPGYRGRGIGRALLEAVRARSEARVEWAVLDWNEPALRFYRSLGARPVEGWTTFRWLGGGADGPT